MEKLKLNNSNFVHLRIRDNVKNLEHALNIKCLNLNDYYYGILIFEDLSTGLKIYLHKNFVVYFGKNKFLTNALTEYSGQLQNIFNDYSWLETGLRYSSKNRKDKFCRK